MKPRSVIAIYDVAGFKVNAEVSHDNRTTVRVDDGMKLSPSVARLLASALTYAAKWAEEQVGTTQIVLDNPEVKA